MDEGAGEGEGEGEGRGSGFNVNGFLLFNGESQERNLKMVIVLAGATHFWSDPNRTLVSNRSPAFEGL